MHELWHSRSVVGQRLPSSPKRAAVGAVRRNSQTKDHSWHPPRGSDRTILGKSGATFHPCGTAHDSKYSTQQSSDREGCTLHCSSQTTPHLLSSNSRLSNPVPFALALAPCQAMANVPPQQRISNQRASSSNRRVSPTPPLLLSTCVPGDTAESRQPVVLKFHCAASRSLK